MTAVPLAVRRPCPRRAKNLALVALAMLPLMLALVGPLIAQHTIDTPVTAPFAAPGDGAPLGGDQLGRDVLSRVLHGGTLLILVVAAAASPLATAGYVEAAQARGESTTYIALREILPNLRATVLTLFGLRFVEAVYIISMAGFLQIGPQPPASDWSLMVRENAPGILLNPWAVIAPSLAIALLAITVNLVTHSLAPETTAKAVPRS
ncbi:ABC transporter permease subunit [Streptomyces sp. NPDC088180]|uniref:ABC transporter permease subunit n=1 Tax=Streptomyces sp. NPDC088180 TaxID=3365837 RepID=UPI0038284CDA